MTTLLDEIEGLRRTRMILAALVAAAALALGVVKVRNELEMTKAYDRQAVALERIADVAERNESRQAVVSPDNGWKRSGNIYTVLEDGTKCWELTYSKPGFASQMTHNCGPHQSFDKDGGMAGTRVGFNYDLNPREKEATGK